MTCHAWAQSPGSDQVRPALNINKNPVYSFPTMVLILNFNDYCFIIEQSNMVIFKG